MLVITRKYDESAVIDIGGKTLEVTVVKLPRKDSVRLCFNGPKDFHIRRKELLPREGMDEDHEIQTNQIALGQSSSDGV